MARIDIFNGDADGICALTQLHNHEPRESTLITGVKRDIELVARADAKGGDLVTVLDVSFDKNREAVANLLATGADVFYVDHHFAGEVPSHPNLHAIIDTDANVCTSLLVNGHLGGAFAEWAVTGAFGDNLKETAEAIATPLGLTREELHVLDTLGTCINYNGYGSSLDDLHFAPDELFRLVSPFRSPFEFVEESRGTFDALRSGYQDDMSAAASISATKQTDSVALFVLPDEAWARRVSGVYSNDLANANPSRAHAVLTERANGTYLVSVRAPLQSKRDADTLCRQFPTGGGRAAAAGINALPADQLGTFIEALESVYA